MAKPSREEEGAWVSLEVGILGGLLQSAELVRLLFGCCDSVVQILTCWGNHHV